jgi:hypothetical protein
LSLKTAFFEGQSRGWRKKIFSKNLCPESRQGLKIYPELPRVNAVSNNPRRKFVSAGTDKQNMDSLVYLFNFLTCMQVFAFRVVGQRLQRI